MACSGYTKIWEMAPGELVGLDGARGTTLRVTRGVLWLTFEGDTRDVVLSVGDVFTIDRGGLTLIEAQQASTVCAMAHQIELVRVGQPRPSFAARVGQWVYDVAEASLHRRWAPYF
jgi:hypothetical protein